jgi:AAA domain-containing protein
MGTTLKYLITLLILSSAAVSFGADRASCKEDEQTLAAITDALTDQQAHLRAIESIASGNLPPDTTLQSLLDVPLTNNKAVSRALAENNTDEESDRSFHFSQKAAEEWPESINCTALQQRYSDTRNDLIWVNNSIHKKQARWLSIPVSLRHELKRLWLSRQRIRSLAIELQESLSSTAANDTSKDTSVDENNDSSRTLSLQKMEAIDAQLQILRLKILALLPELQQPISADVMSELLSLWEYAIDNPLKISPQLDQQIEQLPAEAKMLAQKYLIYAQLDALQMRYLINLVRAWIWQHDAGAVIALARDLPGGIPELLIAESHAIRFQVIALKHTNELSYLANKTDRSPRTAIVTAAIKYIFAFVALYLLFVISRKVSKPLIKINERATRLAKGRRWIANLGRLAGGVAPLAPWLTAWVGLDILAAIFFDTHMSALVALTPLARLYIVYGIMSLVGEWLLLRISQQAGIYLSGDQATLNRPYARHAALAIVTPLFISDIVSLGVGPSLLLSICVFITLTIVYIALGQLLQSRRQEMISSMQSLTPERLDPVIEKMLNGKRFRVFAPLMLPVLLCVFILAFLHKILIDFGWYRKVTARWFKLRVQGSETDDIDAEIATDYSCWFADQFDDKELPYIDTGLLAAMRKPIDRWLEEHTEENSLLVSGERGIGKSSALEKLQAAYTEENASLLIQHVSVPPKTTTPEAVRQLIGNILDTDISEGPAALVTSDEARKPTLIILDNAQNFFLSRVNGMTAWETLLSLTNARLTNVFWVIAINNQSWAYLSNVFGRDYQFRNVLKAKPWSQNDVRSLVLSRNHLSGFKIQYDEVLLASRGPEAGNIRNAEQRYFSLLWDACHGNPMLALRLWLSSVKTIGKTVTVGLPVDPQASQVEKLGGNLLFAYAAITIHENLTSDEITQVTALPESVVRHALKTAFDAGFLQRSEDGRYRLVPIWYHTLTQLLARKNLLHE